jgi:hypothetical protein
MGKYGMFMGKYGMFMGFPGISQLFFGRKWLGAQISSKKLKNLFVRPRKFVRPRRADLEFLFQERYGFRQLMRHVGLPVRWKL